MKNRAFALKTVLIMALLVLTLAGLGAGRQVHAAKKFTLVKGQTKQMKTKATNWKSSNSRIVSVSKTGLLKAKKKGTCRLTGMRNGKKKTWKITVQAPTLSKTTKTVKVKKSFTIKIKGSSATFRWKVSDKSILKLKKKKKNVYTVTGRKNGTAEIIVTKGTYFTVKCKVIVGTGKEDTSDNSNKSDNSDSSDSSKTKKKSSIHTLYMDGNVFKELTWNISDVAKYVSSVSNYGQSARLYTHKDGGDGLENIWADKNNGAIGVPGVKLSAAAVKGTIAKACLWARAIADSEFHGYDFGHSYPGANIMYTFGQAKPTGLGTGDYCCSTIPLCAYYFAGVNVIGENLGGPDALYIPHSTKLFYNGRNGEISFYENGNLESWPYLSNYEWHIFNACGFTDVIDSYKADPDNFIFRAGDVVTANGHSQIVLTDGTRKTAETVQAYGPDKKNKMPKGGDQNYEIGRAYYVRTKPALCHIMRFTGEGVKLNTVGLSS